MIFHIKNKYLRRTTIIVVLPFALIIALPIVAVWEVIKGIGDFLQELPANVKLCWDGPTGFLDK